MSFESQVLERGAGLVVADDEPGRVPVGQRDLVHRAECAELTEERERVVSIVGTPCS
jgi:hypothetical protein